MNVEPPVPVTLTREEQVLFDQIDFESCDHDTLRKSCAAAKPLALSLLKRDAVPQIRRDYFSDAQYNIGGSGSRKEVFERNGTKGEAILEHGNFLKYLRYWIMGPALPPETIAGFCDILNDDIGTSGEQLTQLCAYAKKQIRLHDLPKHEAPEEFYQLCLELGLGPGESRSIRDAAMQVRGH